MFRDYLKGKGTMAGWPCGLIRQDDEGERHELVFWCL